MAVDVKASAAIAALRRKEDIDAILLVKGHCGPVTRRWMKNTARYNKSLSRKCEILTI